MDRNRHGLAPESGAEEEIVGGHGAVLHAPGDLGMLLADQRSYLLQAFPAPLEGQGELHFVEQGGADRRIDAVAPVDPLGMQITLDRAGRRFDDGRRGAHRLGSGI